MDINLDAFKLHPNEEQTQPFKHNRFQIVQDSIRRTFPGGKLGLRIFKEEPAWHLGFDRIAVLKVGVSDELRVLIQDTHFAFVLLV